MKSITEHIVDNAIVILAFSISTIELVAMFVGFRYYFLIGALGYLILLPTISMFTEGGGHQSTTNNDPKRYYSTELTSYEIVALSNRYVYGDFSYSQFKKKLCHKSSNDIYKNRQTNLSKWVGIESGRELTRLSFRLMNHLVVWWINIYTVDILLISFVGIFTVFFNYLI